MGSIGRGFHEYLWRVLERVAVEGSDLVVAEVDRLQSGQPVQRAPLQLRQPVLAQVEVLEADDVDEAPLDNGDSIDFRELPKNGLKRVFEKGK